MNLRQHLADTVVLLDRYPQIKTDKIALPVITALKKFQEKLAEGIADLEEQKAWEDLKSRLVRMTHSTAQIEIERLKESDLLSLCKILSLTKPRATKKLTARQATEAKVLKKIDEIRKQTL